MIGMLEWKKHSTKKKLWKKYSVINNTHFQLREVKIYETKSISTLTVEKSYLIESICVTNGRFDEGIIGFFMWVKNVRMI